MGYCCSAQSKSCRSQKFASFAEVCWVTLRTRRSHRSSSLQRFSSRESSCSSRWRTTLNLHLYWFARNHYSGFVPSSFSGQEVFGAVSNCDYIARWGKCLTDQLDCWCLYPFSPLFAFWILQMAETTSFCQNHPSSNLHFRIAKWMSGVFMSFCYFKVELVSWKKRPRFDAG